MNLDFITQKEGPLPVWAWVAIGAAGWFILKRMKKPNNNTGTVLVPQSPDTTSGGTGTGGDNGGSGISTNFPPNPIANPPTLDPNSPEAMRAQIRDTIQRSLQLSGDPRAGDPAFLRSYTAWLDSASTPMLQQWFTNRGIAPGSTISDQTINPGGRPGGVGVTATPTLTPSSNMMTIAAAPPVQSGV